MAKESATKALLEFEHCLKAILNTKDSWEKKEIYLAMNEALLYTLHRLVERLEREET